jgi:hypothetical protein
VVKLIPAGSLHPDILSYPSAVGTIIVSGFLGEHSKAISQDAYPLIQEALNQFSVLTLYQIDPLFAPFYCPECKLCYCEEHWDIQPVFDDDFMSGWYDYSVGTCPRGHKREVAD